MCLCWCLFFGLLFSLPADLWASPIVFGSFDEFRCSLRRRPLLAALNWNETRFTDCDLATRIGRPAPNYRKSPFRKRPRILCWSSKIWSLQMKLYQKRAYSCCFAENWAVRHHATPLTGSVFLLRFADRFVLRNQARVQVNWLHLSLADGFSVRFQSIEFRVWGSAKVIYLPKRSLVLWRLGQASSDTEGIDKSKVNVKVTPKANSPLNSLLSLLFATSLYYLGSFSALLLSAVLAVA